MIQIGSRHYLPAEICGLCWEFIPRDPSRPTKRPNRHDARRWLRGFRVVAAVAHDAMLLEDRGRACCVLTEVVTYDVAIYLTRGEDVRVSPFDDLNTWPRMPLNYAADDAAATISLARAFERDRGYSSQYQQRPMPLETQPISIVLEHANGSMRIDCSLDAFRELVPNLLGREVRTDYPSPDRLVVTINMHMCSMTELGTLVHRLYEVTEPHNRREPRRTRTSLADFVAAAGSLFGIVATPGSVSRMIIEAADAAIERENRRRLAEYSYRIVNK